MDRTQLSPPMLRKLTAIIRTADSGRAVLEPETRTLLALGARCLVDLSRTNLRDQVSSLPLLRVTIRERGRHAALWEILRCASDPARAEALLLRARPDLEPEILDCADALRGGA